MAKAKNYSKEELQQLDTDELIKAYNRAAERINKQITRLQQAGEYEDVAALRSVERAPVYRSESVKNRALQNMEQLTEDILRLQERSAGALNVKPAAREVKGLKADLVVMLKGSHIGGAQILKEQADDFWKQIKASDLKIVQQAKEHFGATSNSQLFYEIQRRLKVQGNDIPEFNSVSDTTSYLQDAMQNLPNNELPLSEQAALLAKQYTKRF